MKFVGKYSLSFFVKWLIIIVMILTVLVIAALPWFVEKFMEITFMGRNNAYIRNMYLIVLYPSGVFAFLIENELRRMFKTLEDTDPFVTQNVKSLNRMGIFMLGVIVMFIYKIIVFNSMMTMVSAFAMVVISIFCFVLADVFRQAVIYKQENDLVI